MSRHEVTLRRVLYEMPGMQMIEPQAYEFAGADGKALPLRVYPPVRPPVVPSPAVILLEGYPDPGFEQRVGCRFMDMEWTISMAQLIAASGMTAVTHSNRDPEPDGVALMKYLGQKYRKVGVWSTSGNGPVVLVVASHATCAVLNNPITKDFCPDTPLFVIRAGKDETPDLNAALDGFVARALVENKPVTLVNYPEAPHSYELSLDGPETRRILQQGLDFLLAHLR